MKPEDHNRLLGWSHIVWGAMFTLIGVFVVLMFGAVGLMAMFEPHRPNDPPGAFFFIFGLFGLFYILFALPSFVAGLGLLEAKTVGEGMGDNRRSIIGDEFSLGTAVTVYTFWFLFSDQYKILYEGMTPNGYRYPAGLYGAPANPPWPGSEDKTREYQYTPPAQPPSWRDED